MNKISLLALLVVVWAGANPVRAESAGAILRCDPATVIKKIDGDAHRGHWADYGALFKECAIPLSPGIHELQVCYDASSGGGMSTLEVVCRQDRELTIDAQPGRTYRLKINMFGEWKAWIDDVTEAEAGLSYDEPPQKPKPTGSKKDREAIIVMRATPEHAALGLQKGVIRGKWFDVGRFGALKLTNFTTKGTPDGYHVFRAYGGDTVAFTSAQMMNTSVFKLQQVVPCGSFPVRVYEDIAPGKVLYVGHVTIKGEPGSFTGAYSDELAEARAYIDSHYPELTGRLEAAPFREALTANVCLGFGFELATEVR
jgi:hypothetical protein